MFAINNKAFKYKTSQVVSSSLVTAKDILSSLTQLVADPVFIPKGKQLANAILQSKFFPCITQEGNRAGKALSSAWKWSLVVELEKDLQEQGQQLKKMLFSFHK